MSKTSLALNNLRGYAILIVLAFHSSIAYVSNQPAAALPFDEPPYAWTAHPIIDSDRWLGFDLFCAFQFLYMMQLFFFLSGLFVWPSLQRKGARAFLANRLLRLGVPFAVGTYLLMPLAYDAVYRVTASDPSWSAYWSHWMALPFWPAGPMWFLWLMLAFNAVAAGLYATAPGGIDRLAQWAAKSSPIRVLFLLAGVSAPVYIGLAAVFSIWKWIEFGPFSFQAVFAPQYAIYFLLGLVVGARGIERGLLAADGLLRRRWGRWLGAALVAFALWICMTALIVNGVALPGVQLASDLAAVMFAATACLAATAIFLRFGAARWPALDSISDYAYGIYLFHYVFVLWLQYMLLGVTMPAILKGLIVFTVTLALSWAATAAVCSVPIGNRVIGGQRRVALKLARSSAEPAP